MTTIGLIISVVAIGVSLRAAQYARSSTRLAADANAITLSTEVDVSKSDCADNLEIHWKFDRTHQPNSPNRPSPGPAMPGEEYTVPEKSDLLVTLVFAIEVHNSGPRKALITPRSAAAYHVQREDLEVTVLTRNQLLFPGSSMEVEAGSSELLLLYVGQTIDEWITEGSEPGPRSYTAEISATAGPDAALQTWQIEVIGAIFEGVDGNASGVRVATSPRPQVTITASQRTFPRQSGEAFLRSFFLGKHS